MDDELWQLLTQVRHAGLTPDDLVALDRSLAPGKVTLTMRIKRPGNARMVAPRDNGLDGSMGGAPAPVAGGAMSTPRPDRTGDAVSDEFGGLFAKGPATADEGPVLQIPRAKVRPLVALMNEDDEASAAVRQEDTGQASEEDRSEGPGGAPDADAEGAPSLPGSSGHAESGGDPNPGIGAVSASGPEQGGAGVNADVGEVANASVMPPLGADGAAPAPGPAPGADVEIPDGGGGGGMGGSGGGGGGMGGSGGGGMGGSGGGMGGSGASIELLMPEPPSQLSPQAAGRIDEIDERADAASQQISQMPSAESSTAGARAAVTEPRVQLDAVAQASLVAYLDARPKPSTTIEDACKNLKEVIKGKRPKNDDELVNARPREMAKAAGQEMNEDIEQRANSVGGEYKGLRQSPTGQPSRPPTPVDAPPAQVPVGDMQAETGAPDPVPAEDVSLDADVAAQEQRIEEAGMRTEPAELVEDGPIAEARDGAAELGDMAKRDPAEVLAEQATAIASAKSDMRALQVAAVQALDAARQNAVTGIGAKVVDATASEEQQRVQAGAAMQAIFQRTQKSVESSLSGLSSKAMERWNAGVESLSTKFESDLAVVKERLDKRYKDAGIAGGVVKWFDEHLRMPGWVVEAYNKAEDEFVAGCSDLLRDISRDINAIIDTCEQMIAGARTEIDAIVDSLPEELEAWARGEADKIQAQLDGLDDQVRTTQSDLEGQLIGRANGAVNEVHQRVDELREAAKGILGRIGDAIAEFAENPGLFIVNGLLRLVGIDPSSFWSLVDRLGDVVDDIAKDPKGFANGLLTGVGQGFRQFFDHFPQHMMQGIMDWLFSKLGEAGVRMPADFSVKSIVTLVLEILGISWDRIRGLLAKHIGEKNAAVLDKAYELISTLIEQGPEGIFELIKDALDPQTIVDSLIDAAKNYLMEALITKVAVDILAMFTPVGAIKKAIQAIYTAIKWVMENAARIFRLIDAVVDGAAQILAGNTGALAGAVESALAGMIGPVIGFLADLIGLGGIPEAIKKAITGLQDRVAKILDQVIGFLVERARQALAAMGIGGDKKPESEPGAEGIQPVVFMAATGEDGKQEKHTISVSGTGPEAQIILASNDPKEIQHKLEDDTFKALIESDESQGGMEKVHGLVAECYQSLRAQKAENPEGNHDWKSEIDPKLRAVSGYLERLDGDKGVPPVVGRHGVLERLRTTEGPGRHSHHVPPKALALSFEQIFKKGADLLVTDDFSPDVSRYAARFRDRAERAAAMHKNDGPELSAILIDEETHKGAGSSAHGTESIPAATKILDEYQAKQGREFNRILTKAGHLSSNPHSQTLAGFMAVCQEEALKDKDPRVKELYEEARSLSAQQLDELLHDVVITLRRTLHMAFVDSYRQGEAFLAAALQESDRDGDEPTQHLPRLKAEARTAWLPLLGNIAS